MQLSALPETLESLQCSAVAEFGVDSRVTSTGDTPIPRGGLPVVARTKNYCRSNIILLQPRCRQPV